MPTKPSLTPTGERDTVSSQPARIDLSGARRISEARVVFADSFPGSALNTDKWTSTIASGGAVAVTGGKVRLSTSTAATGSAEISGDQLYGPPPGGSLLLRAALRFPIDSLAGNTREIGFKDASGNDRVFFNMVDTGIYSKIDRNHASTLSQQTTIPSPDGNEYMVVEIEANKDEARISVDGTEVGAFEIGVGQSDPLFSSVIWKPFVKVVNSSGSTDHQMDVASLQVAMLGDGLKGEARIIEWSQALDGKIIEGSGVLEAWQLISTAGQAWTVYDNASAASGRVMAKKVGLAPAQPCDVPVRFDNGLYFDHVSGAADTLLFYVRGA